MRCKLHEQENCQKCFPAKIVNPPINPETGAPYLDRPTGQGPSGFAPRRPCGCTEGRKHNRNCPEAIKRREERAAIAASRCPGCHALPDQDHLDGCTGRAPEPTVKDAVESLKQQADWSGSCGCPLGTPHREDCEYMRDWRERQPESYAQLQSEQAKALGAAVGHLFKALTGLLADPETGAEVLTSLNGKRHRVVDLDIAGHKLGRQAQLPDGSTLKLELKIQRQWPVDPAEVEAANKVNC